MVFFRRFNQTVDHTAGPRTASPAPKSSMMPFTDVPAGSYYETAVLWAAENGITGGTGNNAFSPDADCTRAQIVTFLYRSET